MEEAGLKLEVIETSSEDAMWDFEIRGYNVVKEMIEGGLEKDATILCANDRLAMGAFRAANEAGMFTNTKEKPSKFRVAGHDDHPLSQYMWPSMTTVSQDVARIGRAAVDCV